MLCIRLARTGAKKKPHYRVVVIEKERARNGRFLEIVGDYHPTGKKGEKSAVPLHLDRERIQYWISNGAQPSATVTRLIGKTETVGSVATEDS